MKKLLAFLLIVIACEEAQVYVYSAQRYNEDEDCVGRYEAIETVPGPDVYSKCAKRCLTVKEAVFVSTVCPPLPAIANDLPPTDPTCQKALAAQICSDKNTSADASIADASAE